MATLLGCMLFVPVSVRMCLSGATLRSIMLPLQLGLIVSPLTQMLGVRSSALCGVTVTMARVPGTLPVASAAFLSGLSVTLILGFRLALILLLTNSTGVLLCLFLLTIMMLWTLSTPSRLCTVPIVVRLVVPLLLCLTSWVEVRVVVLSMWVRFKDSTWLPKLTGAATVERFRPVRVGWSSGVVWGSGKIGGVNGELRGFLVSYVILIWRLFPDVMS